MGRSSLELFFESDDLGFLSRSYIKTYLVYFEKLHTVVYTHLLYVGSNCCKAQGLDESVEDRLNLNTAPQFGTLVVPHCLYKKDCC